MQHTAVILHCTALWLQSLFFFVRDSSVIWWMSYYIFGLEVFTIHSLMTPWLQHATEWTQSPLIRHWAVASDLYLFCIRVYPPISFNFFPQHPRVQHAMDWTEYTDWSLSCEVWQTDRLFNVYQYIIGTMPSVEPQLWKIFMPCWSDILINTHPNSDNSDQSQRLSCLFDNLTDRQELHVFTLVPNQSFWLQIMTHRDKKTTFSQRASWNDIRKT